MLVKEFLATVNMDDIDYISVTLKNAYGDLVSKIFVEDYETAANFCTLYKLVSDSEIYMWGLANCHRGNGVSVHCRL